MTVEEKDTKETIKAKYQSSTDTADYYRSYIYVNNAILSKIGVNNTKELKTGDYKAIKTKLLDGTYKFAFSKSKTSSAGTIYRLIWLQDTLGLTWQELSTVYKSSNTQEDYPSAGLKVGTDKGFDFAAGFSDIRGEVANEADLLIAYKNSSVIGMSYQIINDGIMYSRKKVTDSATINDLRESFKSLISKSENKEIFNVYNIGPESAEKSKEWEATLDTRIDTASTKANTMAELIKDWTK